MEDRRRVRKSEQCGLNLCSFEPRRIEVGSVVPEGVESAYWKVLFQHEILDILSSVAHKQYLCPLCCCPISFLYVWLHSFKQ